MPLQTSKYKPKPKSRDLFYSLSPLWSDVKPVPLIEGAPPLPSETSTSTDSDNAPSQPPPPPAPAPALATIAYSPRYTEAMSYLRAVMAANEFSVRSVALTEDIIGMNPAHYTVWLFRMKCLKVLWGAERADGEKVAVVEEVEGDGDGGEQLAGGGTDEEERIRRGVDEELMWLDGVSERNLKNYQIWHHRQTLFSLLPALPPTEPAFLAHILSFDAKNYHVWTYRQWLCRHFRDPLLTTNMELDAIDTLLEEDVRNNSAWNHRYFVIFGAEELDVLEKEGSSGNRKDLFENDGGDVKGGGGLPPVDRDVLEREIAYTKAKIELAPQNPSPWNYLRGILKRGGMPLAELRGFCEGFVGRKGDAESEIDLWTQGEKGVRSSHAIEWLAEIYAEDAKGEGGNEEKRGRQKELAKECLKSLAEKWDPIRRKYWEYKGKRMGLT